MVPLRLGGGKLGRPGSRIDQTAPDANHRGVRAVTLSESATFEQCASLLWDAKASDPFARSNVPALSQAMRAILDATRDAKPIDRTGEFYSDLDDGDLTLDADGNFEILLSTAGCNFFMGLPMGDDVMLNYQSTSFHDGAALRQLFGFRPAPEFEAWLEEIGVMRDGKLTSRAGDPSVLS